MSDRRKPVFRCSSLDRRLLCHGSGKLEALVDDREGDEGAEGAELHRQIAVRLIAELGAAGEPTDDGDRPKVSPFTQWVVGYCFQEVRANAPAGWSLEVELALAFEFARFILSGHIDACSINPEATEAVAWDYKTGVIPVSEAEENEQVLGYVCLLLLAYPSLRKVTFYIVQPRNDEDEGFQRVSYVTIEGDVLASCVAVLEERLNEALDNPMEIDTGWKQCAWCPVGIQCPGIQAERDFMKLKLTSEMLAKIHRTPDDALLGDFVISARTLTKPIEDATKMLKERINKQKYVDSGSGTRITIQKRPGQYDVPNPVAFYTKLTEMIPDPAKRAKCLKPKMGEIKDTIAEVYNVKKTGQDAETALTIFDANLRPLCEQKDTELLVFK